MRRGYSGATVTTGKMPPSAMPTSGRTLGGGGDIGTPGVMWGSGPIGALGIAGGGAISSGGLGASGFTVTGVSSSSGTKVSRAPNGCSSNRGC